MVMSNKVMTRDEVAAHVRDMFARLDTNKDGYITREELGSMREHLMAMRGGKAGGFAAGAMPHLDRGAMFDRLDTNRDGSISRQEYMSAQPQVRTQRVVIREAGPEAGTPGGPGAPNMRMHRMGMGMGFGGRLFDMADANHDGRVSLAEAQAAALAHFDRADTNRDGKITPEERQQVRRVRIERRQG
jgi:Ca2+-binding EF-hand superfamily protein